MELTSLHRMEQQMVPVEAMAKDRFVSFIPGVLCPSNEVIRDDGDIPIDESHWDNAALRQFSILKRSAHEAGMTRMRLWLCD